MATGTQKENARHAMPAQDPGVRAHNFGEVALGYDMVMAVEEANRCIQCRRPLCVTGCPVQVRIPEFIKALREGDMWQAVAYLKDNNSLPAICGRVCPQETQCEALCVLGRRGEPVAIGRLERFVADWEREQGVRVPETAGANGMRVAIIGSGPAGLTAAGDLAKKGYKVDILEALHESGVCSSMESPSFGCPKPWWQRRSTICVNWALRLGTTSWSASCTL